MLSGLRGVGKTALLNELLSQATDRHWITAKIEAGAARSLGIGLSQELTVALRTATGQHSPHRLSRLLSVFKSFSLTVNPSGAVSFGVDVEAAAGHADTGAFADDLTALFVSMGEAARDLGIGVLIEIDEMQEARKSELAALNQSVHRLGQAAIPLPVMVIGAGLPSLPVRLAEASSYAERLWYFQAVNVLDEAASRAALVVPVQDEHAEWDEDALTAALAIAQGYPYLLQAVGKHIWDNAIGRRIDLEDTTVGLAAAQREVDDGLYRSRWERATGAQQDLLRALAEVGGDGAVAIADLARQVNKRRASDLSAARDQLIKKGLVYAPQRGLLAFTIPGMSAFIARQP